MPMNWDSLQEIDKFLKTDNLLRLNPESVNKTSRQITVQGQTASQENSTQHSEN